jgi:hypothetical protein
MYQGAPEPPVALSRRDARFRRKCPDVIRTCPEELDAWHREGTRTLNVLDADLVPDAT